MSGIDPSSVDKAPAPARRGGLSGPRAHAGNAVEVPESMTTGAIPIVIDRR